VEDSLRVTLANNENYVIVRVMAGSEPTAGGAGTLRDHGFHPLRIAQVIRETADTRSFVFEIPDELKAAFAYEAGQFCNLRVEVDGAIFVRCYSMSSAPAVDAQLQVTVKRVPDGRVSNWLMDNVGAEDLVEVSVPAGFFQLTPTDNEVVAFGAGSGITPVFSLLKSTLATTGRRVRLLYANRDRDSVIFASELAELEQRHPDRLTVLHHLDVERGFVNAETVGCFAGPPSAAEYYICGPAPFMEVVEETLMAGGADPARLHIERFTPAPGPVVDPSGDSAGAVAVNGSVSVTIELDGRSATTEHHPGTTILQTARQMGMAPPFSCESGSCATCMAKLVEGEVSMYVNNALTEDEVAAGWVLTCQSVPTSPSVRVLYGFDEE
jgi:3-ketosteroid 9alpha-monooxygenase subunit B